jgi:lipoprotein-anchoring transpeptidase ErfK/SrfK
MRATTPRVAIALSVVAAVVAVGAGASAFGPSRSDVVAYELDAQAATVDASGASASPGPTANPPAVTPSQPAPTTGAAKTPTKAPSKAPTACKQGDKQLPVEQFLAQIRSYGPVTVDGRQSPADCATIKKFQSRFGISPANGQAGRTTADVARRIAGSLTPAERAKCNAGSGTTACVDLTLQTVWVVKNGAVVFGPTVVRTGKAGYATPSGTFKIDDRSLKAWSNPYEVWLPYWQHITRGDGFHETTTYIHNTAIGSHGCVNLLHSDAKTMWTTIGYGTTVKLFGRRPGT